MIHCKEIGSVHSRLLVVYWLSRRADLRSCRTAFKPLELATPGAYAARPVRGRQRSTSELVVWGRAVLLTYNKDTKLADIRSTAARVYVRRRRYSHFSCSSTIAQYLARPFFVNGRLLPILSFDIS